MDKIMTEKQYIKQVGKHLLCKPKQKQELLRQLESDIRGAVAEGETLEAVFARMGQPEKFAEEFNGNFPEEEKLAVQKGKKRKAAAIIGGTVILALIALGIGIYWFFPKAKPMDGTVFEKEAVEMRAKELIGYLERDDYQALYEASDERMQEALGEDCGKELFRRAKEGISEKWGAFRSFGNSYIAAIEQRGAQFAVVQMNVSYEGASVTYTITLDEEMRLDGFYMK